MATLNITQALEWTENGINYIVGSKVTPTQVTYSAGLVGSGSVSLAKETDVQVFSIGAGLDIASAEVIAITNSTAAGVPLAFSVLLEGSNAANNSSVGYAAGTYCIITDGKIYTYDAAGGFGSTVQVDIQDVWVRNDSTTTTGIIRWWAWG